MLSCVVWIRVHTAMGGSPWNKELRIWRVGGGRKARRAVIWRVRPWIVTIMTTPTVRIQVFVVGGVIDQHGCRQVCFLFPVRQLARDPVLVLYIRLYPGGSGLWATPTSPATGQIAITHSAITDVTGRWTGRHCRCGSLLPNLLNGQTNK